MERCLNDVFGYCYSKPQPVEHQETTASIDWRGKSHTVAITVIKCLHNQRTCSQYLTHTRLHALLTE